MSYRLIAAVGAAGLLIAACTQGSSSPDGSAAPQASGYLPVINPADFSTTVDNAFLPFIPGTKLVYD